MDYAIKLLPRLLSTATATAKPKPGLLTAILRNWNALPHHLVRFHDRMKKHPADIGITVVYQPEERSPILE